MKQVLTLLALGLAALMAQGAAALVVPARLMPDVGLLLVVAAALWLRSTTAGIVLAALLGYATDLLSGSLLGQHTLLRMAAYGGARFGHWRLNLRGALPQALFVGLLSVAYALCLWGLVAFVAPEAGAPALTLSQLLPHALVNALAAPVVSRGVAMLLARLGDDDGSQRLLPLEPRNYSV